LRMFMTEMFSNKHIEHAATFIVWIFWCVGLPYINDTSNLLAVDMDGALVNINLFFSSWVAFIMSMILFADMFPSLVLGDRVSGFTKHWVYFGTASLIAMTNAVMFWRDNCETIDDSKMCHRDLFAFVLGAVSGLFAVVFFAYSHERLEQVISILLFTAWCFGVAYLTFDHGPAMFVGTFYFSIWFSFMFAFWMAVHSVVALYNGMTGGGSEAEVATDTAPGEGKGQEETAKQDAEEHEKEEVVQEGNV